MADYIWKACQAGDLHFFRSCLESDKSASLKKYSHLKSGDALVHMVCRFGHANLLRLLYDKGFPLEVENFDGKRPLHEAAQMSNFKCVKFLLEAGVKVDSLKRADWTPLMLACTKMDTDIIKLLLKFGANPDLINKDGWNCFHIAAREGHLPVIEVLLDHGASWDIVSKNGRTPLHTAALHGHTDLISYLLNRCGYLPDMQDSCGTTPLMDALRVQNIDIARMLISRHKSGVSTADNLGRQAIHQAAQAGADNSIRFLVEECSVDQGARSKGQGITALQMAAKEGHSDTILVLLSLGAEVNSQDDKGRTALHIASGAQHASCAEVLLQNGALSLPDKTGATPRQLAKKQTVIDVFDKHLRIS